MRNQLAVTQSEWYIMELLWEKPRTLMEMVAILAKEIGWSKSTVTTMVRRMTEKGLLAYKTEGRTKVFRSAVTRKAVVARETDSLLQRAYRGSVGLMFSAMVERTNLSQTDIDELYAILEKAREDGK